MTYRIFLSCRLIFENLKIASNTLRATCKLNNIPFLEPVRSTLLGVRRRPNPVGSPSTGPCRLDLGQVDLVTLAVSPLEIWVCTSEGPKVLLHRIGKGFRPAVKMLFRRLFFLCYSLLRSIEVKRVWSSN